MTELDLRQQRTRGALQAALIALVTEMPFESLTVADVTRRARVARKTFYAHYPDKDALLLDCVAPVLEAVAASVSHTDVETLLADNKPLSYPVFKLVGERAGFYSALLNEQGSARLIVFVLDFLTRHSYERHERLWRSAPRQEVEPLLIAHFLAGALFNSVRWWLRQACQPSAEIMAYTFSRLAAPGALGALGYDPS